MASKCRTNHTKNGMKNVAWIGVIWNPAMVIFIAFFFSVTDVKPASMSGESYVVQLMGK